MKNKTLLSLFFASIPIIGGCQMLENPPLNKLVVRVVDETGHPVGNAYVSAWTYWTDGGKIRGLTNTNGFFYYKDRVFREIGYKVMKDGYYDSIGEAWWPKTRYQVPETNLVVELKRIIEPMNMTYHNVVKQIPRLDKPVAFDFEVGDWVFPEGKGKVADCWVSATNQWVSKDWYDYYATLSFSNDFNGIMTIAVPSRIGHRLKSELRPTQYAPEAGYEKKLEFHGGKHKEATGIRYFESIFDNRVYVFRVRSVTNEVGEVVSANVGWLEGNGTNIYRKKEDGSIGIAFEYYYNPDPHSRSLEPKDIADRQAKDIPETVK